MRVAVSGTPGTGKTTACSALARQNYHVVDLSELAARNGLVEPPKEPGSSGLVDISRISQLELPAGDLVFFHSHFAHLLHADMVVVLRCSPKVLRSRLRARGWGEEKIRENLEAEAIDLITVEALENCKKVFEVDTTSIDIEETARQIIEIVRGAVAGHEPGRIDWSEEILSWY